MSKANIQVILGNAQLPQALHDVLNSEDYTTSFWQLSAILHDGLPTRAADAIIVVVRPDLAQTNHRLEVLFDRLADDPCPVLVVSVSGDFAMLPAAPPQLPVSFVPRITKEAFVARLSTILEMRGSFHALASAVKAERTEAEAVMQRYQQQLRLASRVQKELASRSISRIGPVSFRSVNRSVDYVSGDIFEITQLTDHFVGLFLADATGHGLPAAMLTTFMRRALQRASTPTRPACPSQILARLNHDLLDADLSECPFVAAFCGLLNLETLEFTWSRAGTPYPIHRHAHGEAEVLHSTGRVLGVSHDSVYETHATTLLPGASFLAYSDGLDQVIDGVVTIPQVAAAFAHAAEAAREFSSVGATTGPLKPVIRSNARASTGPETNGAWPSLVETLGVDEALQMASIRFDMLRRMGKALDDLTILGVQIDA
ncbi:MAG: PP2C family protein-serine/threonine phosphatase [Phycisphaerae bacterium]